MGFSFDTWNSVPLCIRRLCKIHTDTRSDSIGMQRVRFDLIWICQLLNNRQVVFQISKSSIMMLRQLEASMLLSKRNIGSAISDKLGMKRRYYERTSLTQVDGGSDRIASTFFGSGLIPCLSMINPIWLVPSCKINCTLLQFQAKHMPA